MCIFLFFYFRAAFENKLYVTTQKLKVFFYFSNF